MKSLVLVAILCVAQVKALNFSNITGDATDIYDEKLGEGFEVEYTSYNSTVVKATSTRPIHTTTPRKANVTDIDTDVYDESLESGVKTDISTHPTVDQERRQLIKLKLVLLTCVARSSRQPVAKFTTS